MLDLRLRALAAVFCIPLFLSACGGGNGDNGGSDEADASPSAEATEESEFAGEVLLEEDFETDAGPFQTASEAEFIIEPSNGVFSFFLAGQGDDHPTVIRSAAELDQPVDAMSVEADFTFTTAYGSGVGGWALRCMVGDVSYLFTYELVAKEIDGTTYMGIWEANTEGVEELAKEPVPEGVTGGDGTATFRAECRGAGEGEPAELTFFADDQELLSATDDTGIGTFDTVGIGGEWRGEEIGPGEGAQPGGLYFAADNLRVTGL